MYQKVSTDMDFVKREKKVEQFWKENKIFEKDVYKRQLHNREPQSRAFFSSCSEQGFHSFGHILYSAPFIPYLYQNFTVSQQTYGYVYHPDPIGIGMYDTICHSL